MRCKSAEQMKELIKIAKLNDVEIGTFCDGEYFSKWKYLLVANWGGLIQDADPLNRSFTELTPDQFKQHCLGTIDNGKV